MEKIWLIAITIAIFLLLNFLFYISLNGYVKKVGGKKMWKTWGSKLYFWQSAIYTSTAVTILIMLILKWTDVLTF